MKTVIKLFAGIPLLFGCSDNAHSKLEVRMTENLSVLVHPLREDRKGYKEAEKICGCVIKKVVTEWEAERVERFDDELSEHAAEIRSFNTKMDVQAMLSGKSAYPSPSGYLGKELNEIRPFVEECEERVGGRGVEF